MDKQNEVYPHNEFYLAIKRNGSPDTCYNMDEPWKHNAKWKKPVTKDHILHNSTYMKCPEQANPQTKSIKEKD